MRMDLEIWQDKYSCYGRKDRSEKIKKELQRKLSQSKMVRHRRNCMEKFVEIVQHMKVGRAHSEIS